MLQDNKLKLSYLGHLSLKLSSMEVVFHLFKIFHGGHLCSLLKFHNYFDILIVDLQLIKSNFCLIPPFSSFLGPLLLRLEVILHIPQIVLSSTRVDLQKLESQTCSFPAGEINT